MLPTSSCCVVFDVVCQCYQCCQYQVTILFLVWCVSVTNVAYIQLCCFWCSMSMLPVLPIPSHYFVFGVFAGWGHPVVCGMSVQSPGCGGRVAESWCWHPFSDDWWCHITFYHCTEWPLQAPQVSYLTGSWCQFEEEGEKHWSPQDVLPGKTSIISLLLFSSIWICMCMYGDFCSSLFSKCMCFGGWVGGMELLFGLSVNSLIALLIHKNG